MHTVPLHLHIPSLPVDSLEYAARECAAVWRRSQEQMPPFAALPQASTTAIERYARTARATWEHILILGIGGSSLGAQAVIQGVQGPEHLRTRSPHIHFLDNVDPLETTMLLAKLPLRKTLIVVITKSGGTLETLSTFALIQKKLGKSWHKNTLIITDPQSGYLRTLATQHQLDSFSIPPLVGGRFSVLSACGLVPAALAGVRIRDLLAGAREVQATDAFHFALVQAGLHAQGKNITVFCPYARFLRKLGEWYCQLLAESIGKDPRIGITPEVSLGATDQHSKLQLWSDGPDDKFYLFFGIKHWSRDLALPAMPPACAHLSGTTLATILAAEHTGTLSALREKGRPLASFILPELSERPLGYLLQFFMLQTAFLGEILGVDPYSQPGVERGKILTHALLTKSKKSMKK